MYQTKKFDHLLGLPGFSDTMLKNHFTLYEGYVKNTNKLLEEISKMDYADLSSPEFGELKRRFGWEFDGMRLHEYYFENLSKDAKPLDKGSDLYKKMIEQFGSVEDWVKYFKATGAVRGIGWTILYYDKQADKLLNVWINEHDTGHLAGCVPLLVMDAFEHAYMTDYGLKRADYIESFTKGINWDVVAGRLK